METVGNPAVRRGGYLYCKWFRMDPIEMKKKCKTRKVVKKQFNYICTELWLLMITTRPRFVTSNTSGNVQTSHQKYPVLLPETMLKIFWRLIRKIGICCHKYSWKRGVFTATSLTTTQDTWSSVLDNPSGRSSWCDGNVNPCRAGLTCRVEPSQAKEALTGTELPLEQQVEVE